MDVVRTYLVLYHLMLGSLAQMPFQDPTDPCLHPDESQRPMACPVDLPVNDRDIIASAYVLIDWLNAQHPGHSLLSIHRAQSAVVAGFIYTLWLTIWKVDHEKFCQARIWHKPDGSLELSTTTC